MKTGGTYTIVHYPGSVGGIARDINNLGEIVGFYSDGTTIHGYVRQ